jgi:hypothetical protein
MAKDVMAYLQEQDFAARPRRPRWSSWARLTSRRKYSR